jgi:TRAP-type uncharacterized transport system fused permease subunit
LAVLLKKERMKTKIRIIFLIIICYSFYAQMMKNLVKLMKTLKARKSIYQCWLMEKQTYYVNQSGISLNSEGGYTLEIKMDIQKIVIYGKNKV